MKWSCEVSRQTLNLENTIQRFSFLIKFFEQQGIVCYNFVDSQNIFSSVWKKESLWLFQNFNFLPTSNTSHVSHIAVFVVSFPVSRLRRQSAYFPAVPVQFHTRFVCSPKSRRTFNWSTLKSYITYRKKRWNRTRKRKMMLISSFYKWSFEELERNDDFPGISETSKKSKGAN